MSYILIVDDNQDTCQTLTRAFEKVGLPCKVVSDGQQALTLIYACRPALIITDLLMPNICGFTLLGMLQGDPETHDIPVIVLSSAAPSDLGRLPGVVEVMQKGRIDLVRLREQALRVIAPVASMEGLTAD